MKRVTTVVNVRRAHGVNFGNPFKRGEAGALDRYQSYLLERVEREPEFRAAVLALRGKVLGCFCAGKEPLEPAWAREGARCHGQILARWADEQSSVTRSP